MVLGAALLAGVVAGCTTTQQTASRLNLRSERENAGHRPIAVSRTDPNVRVLKASLVQGPGGGAIAVRLRNTGSDPVNDLPLAVGVRTPAGGTVFLNSQGHLPYFQTHAPALAPGQETTWVFTSEKPLPAGSPTVRVGVPPSHPLTTASSVPTIDVGRVTSSAGKRKGAQQTTVVAKLANHTGMPQYGLEVYAWADKHGTYVAAGRGSIDDLGTDSTATVKLKLIGNLGGARVHVAAPPTIFQ